MSASLVLKSFETFFHSSSQLLTPRLSSASTLINQERTIFVTGGQNAEDYYIKTTEYFTPGQDPASTYGPELPNGLRLHCMVAINESTLLLTGGTSNEDSNSKFKSWFFDLGSEVWTEGPQMQYEHYAHACGKFTDSQGSDVVVVAGGLSSSDFYIEVLYMDQPTVWIRGKRNSNFFARVLYQRYLNI